MEAKKFLEADYLDIVFENRNKNYGGYELRRNYTRRVKKAGGFALLGVLSLSLFSFIASNKKEPEKILPPICEYKIQHLDKDKIIPPPPQEIKPPSPPPSAPQVSFAVSQIVDDDLADKPLARVDELTTALPGTSNTPGDSALGGPPTSGTGVVSTGVVTPSSPEIRTFVEQMPEFQGNLQEYLAKNIRYPENARDAGIQGRVAVQFVVNTDGAVTDLKVIKGIGGGCDEEALRVLSASPKWKPGRQNGTAVRTYFTQVVAFKLE